MLFITNRKPRLGIEHRVFLPAFSVYVGNQTTMFLTCPTFRSRVWTFFRGKSIRRFRLNALVSSGRKSGWGGFYHTCTISLGKHVEELVVGMENKKLNLQNRSGKLASKIDLPITLPTYNGRFEEWREFRVLYGGFYGEYGGHCWWA